MSKEQNWNDIGVQVRDAVQDALSTGDFKKLNDAVAGTVNSAIAEAKRQIEKSVVNQNERLNTDSYQPSTRSDYVNVHADNQKKQLPAVKINKVGELSGILYMTFGGIGMGIFSILLLITVIGLLSWGWGIWPIVFTGALAFGFGRMIKAGNVKRKRLKRARRYVQLCGNNSYINIDDLAAHTGQSVKKVLRDVKRMIRMGIFPQGHLDEQETCLMLDDKTHREYLQLRKERKALEIEEKVAAMQKKRLEKAGTDSDSWSMTDRGEDSLDKETLASADNQDVEMLSPELADMIAEGQGYISRLRAMNEAIEGEVVSVKLDKLETLLKEIFDRVKEHPEQMPQMQKFMNYYLPTTLKLVEAYEEFDSVSVPGEDILCAKAEIEKTLDTINQAFAELLNKLFRASVFDITTDAQVLQTMLAKEGLTKSGLITSDIIHIEGGTHNEQKFR